MLPAGPEEIRGRATHSSDAAAGCFRCTATCRSMSSGAHRPIQRRRIILATTSRRLADDRRRALVVDSGLSRRQLLIRPRPGGVEHCGGVHFAGVGCTAAGARGRHVGGPLHSTHGSSKQQLEVEYAFDLPGDKRIDLRAPWLTLFSGAWGTWKVRLVFLEVPRRERFFDPRTSQDARRIEGTA